MKGRRSLQTGGGSENDSSQSLSSAIESVLLISKGKQAKIPVLFSDSTSIQATGFKTKHSTSTRTNHTDHKFSVCAKRKANVDDVPLRTARQTVYEGAERL